MFTGAFKKGWKEPKIPATGSWLNTRSVFLNNVEPKGHVHRTAVGGKRSPGTARVARAGLEGPRAHADRCGRERLWLRVGFDSARLHFLRFLA